MSGLEIVLVVVAVILLLSRPFVTTFILRRDPDKAASIRFLSYRWAAVAAGICAVILVVLLLTRGGR